MTFNPAKPDRIAHALRKRLVHRVEQAADAMRSTPGHPLTDHVIHAARKHLKKARATLRLLRGSVGERKWRQADHALRDAGRPLSAARDAAARVQTFDALLATPAERRRFADVRRALVARHTDAGTTKSSHVVLAKLASRIDRWKVDDDGYRSVGDALQRAYRDARRALRRAVRKPADDAAWHAARKRAKTLNYAIALLEPIDPARIRAMDARLQALTNRLGEDHDAFMLADAIAGALARELDVDAVAHLLTRIGTRRVTLKAAAQRVGAAMFKAKPKVFARQLREAWHAFATSA